MTGVGRIWKTLFGGVKPQEQPHTQVPVDELARWLPKAPVIIEAGAHLGADTLQLARRWRSGVVHAFEPVPALRAELTRRVGRLPNVRVHSEALSDRCGLQILHLSSGTSDGSSSLRVPDLHLQIHPEVTFAERIEVEAVTLDVWAARRGVSRVDFLWLDLQGVEPEVLRASPRILAGVAAIHTEVSLLPAYQGAVLYPEFRAWMEAQGFRVEREILPYPDMGNVLFVRK